MLKPRFALPIAGACVFACAAGALCAQSYPARAIRIIAAPPGGTGDVIGRLVAQWLGPLGQPVVVENRPTGMMAELAYKAQPDGYTLLVSGSILWLAPFMQTTAYDPVRDFSPVTLAMSSPHVLVASPLVPANSVRELIAAAKAEPGKLNYASSGTGTSVHLAAELFKAMAGVNIVHVPYKGSGPAFNDLIGGQVQIMFAVAAAGMPHVKSGRLKALAVTGREPSALAPNVPTVAASGVPGYEAVGAFGVLAPAKTPEAIINRLNQEIVRALASPEVKEKVLNIGFDAVGSSPQAFAAAIKSEMSVLGKVIKDAGIRGGD